MVNNALFSMLLKLVVSITPYSPILESEYPVFVAGTTGNIMRVCANNLQEEVVNCYKFLSAAQAVYLYQQNIIVYDATIDFTSPNNYHKLAHEITHVLQHHKYKYEKLSGNKWMEFEREADWVARRIVNVLQEDSNHRTAWDGVSQEHVGSENRGWK